MVFFFRKTFLKDTHRENAVKYKTQALMKSMNIWTFE